MRLYSSSLFFTIDMDLVNCTEFFVALVGRDGSNDDEYEVSVYGHGACAPTIKHALLILHSLTLFFLLFEVGPFHLLEGYLHRQPYR